MDTPTPLDATLPLASGVDCIACGYDLRGLSPDGSCPECGCSIHESTREDWLASADRAWLERVVGGLGWLSYGLPAVFVVAVVATTLAYGPYSQSTLAARLVLVAAMGAAGLWVVLRVTAPEPGLSVHRRRNWRAWAAASVAAMTLGVALLQFEQTGSNWRWQCFATAAMTGGVLCFHRLFHHVARLVRRAPDAAVARRAHNAAWWAPVSFALLPLGLAVQGAAVLGLRMAWSSPLSTLGERLEQIGVIAWVLLSAWAWWILLAARERLYQSLAAPAPAPV